MEQNIQPNENNVEIKLDGEGEPIVSKFKKKINKKIVLLIIIILIIIGSGAVYFLFLNKEDNSQLPTDNDVAVLEDKKEVEIDKELDSDQDGLPDYMEKILGTDINNSDTDGDGYGDFEEIKNGYNPLTDKKYAEEEWEAVKGRIKNEDEELYKEVFGNFDETTDWKTYRNEEIGFEFKHPSNLELTGVYKQKNSLLETDAYFQVPIQEYKDDEVNREDFVIAFKNRAYYEDKEANFQEIVMEARRRASVDVLAEEKNIIISNMDAIKFKYKDNLSNIPNDEVITYEAYIQKSDGKIFSIGASIKLSEQEIYLPILNRILSTFKFIDKN